MEKVKVAICGTGEAARIHAKSLRLCPECDLVAVYSREKKRGVKFADEFSIPEVYDDVDEMVERPDIDAVTLAVPNDLHKDLCVKVANSGKHVFVEKPLCLNMEELKKILREKNSDN